MSNPRFLHSATCQTVNFVDFIVMGVAVTTIVTTGMGGLGVYVGIGVYVGKGTAVSSTILSSTFTSTFSITFGTGAGV